MLTKSLIKLWKFNKIDLVAQLLRRYNFFMSFFLFIGNDADFNRRIQKEAGSKAMIAESLSIGAELVSDPTHCFKAIYLNPNDSSFSALALLDICLNTRPGTPVYLIDPSHEIHSPTLNGSLSGNQLKGVFGIDTSFSTFLATSNSNQNFIIPKNLKRPVASRQHTGFIGVPAIDFAHTGHFLFDVFTENEAAELSLYATAGSEVTLEILEPVAHGSHLYVSEKNISEIRNQIRATRRELVGRTHFPVSWKMAETLYKAKSLLRELQSKNLSDEAVNSTYDVLEDVFQIINQIQATKDSHKLHHFIEQAMSCDRNIACATLSILMCKSLKYEKNAIEEILGVASMFQDIALYHSPFGDLSKISPEKMTPAQQEYYLNHPTITADLLAENTSIPAVTLQVIRQHHERRDRTGFPRKIGGIQFHPMAEVLSLINDVIDQNPQSMEAENEIYRHYSDQIVHSYKEIQFRRNRNQAAA